MVIDLTHNESTIFLIYMDNFLGIFVLSDIRN